MPKNCPLNKKDAHACWECLYDFGNSCIYHVLKEEAEERKHIETEEPKDRKEIFKVVNVSDPENWYGQSTVVVKLFICPEYERRTDVRIFVESIDDFAMEYTRTCHSAAEVDCAYRLIKENMFDKLPDSISYGWLLEHGYFPY